MTARKTRFSIGEWWFCDRTRTPNPYNRPKFYFVIEGPGRNSRYKLCRLVLEDGTSLVNKVELHEYSHDHLKKVAVHCPTGTFVERCYLPPPQRHDKG